MVNLKSNDLDYRLLFKFFFLVSTSVKVVWKMEQKVSLINISEQMILNEDFNNVLSDNSS